MPPVILGAMSGTFTHWAVAALARVVPEALTAQVIVRPLRHTFGLKAALPHRPVSFRSDDGLTLRGWLFPRAAASAPRGLLVYLHGHSDNRQLSIHAARRFTPLGFDVLAYDSRAHGQSEGRYCTFGLRERVDLLRALDAVGASSAGVIGSSLGGAVALQAAAADERIRWVVAHAPFCDLATAIADRAALVRRELLERLKREAERQAGLCIAEISTLEAAGRVQVPVLLVHGRHDRETPPAHSARIHDVLRGPRQLKWFEAAHADVMRRPEVWATIERWVLALLA